MGTKGAKEMKGSTLIKLGFRGQLTGPNTLRVDIATGNPVLRGFDVKSCIPAYADINPFSIRVMKPEEMLAEKVHSLLARERARDLFDLFFLVRIAKADRALIEEKLRNFGMKFNARDLERKISGLKSVWIPELRPFVLSELPDFKNVKDFVVAKLS
ncbi:MAG: nucleotidyl transferase AbiEii/AbiGii toxin family protein [Candidatus Aenigmarchaeota archaeon]|nr:nucleotidyl transferase AbiEii/AbiGii toxin family protein [Candidatus Aenigmarchaeota archaeon]